MNERTYALLSPELQVFRCNSSGRMSGTNFGCSFEGANVLFYTMVTFISLYLRQMVCHEWYVVTLQSYSMFSLERILERLERHFVLTQFWIHVNNNEISAIQRNFRCHIFGASSTVGIKFSKEQTTKMMWFWNYNNTCQLFMRTNKKFWRFGHFQNFQFLSWYF